MKHPSGMSLLQCCIVIALIVFISSLSMHFMNVHSKSAVRFELEKLYAAIVMLQRTAIVHGVEQRLVVTPDIQSYAFGKTVQKLAQGVQFGFIPESWGPPAQPVYQILNSVTFKDNTIVCYPDGLVSAGSIYLTDKKSRYLFAITSGIVPTIFLHMYQYDKKQKKWHKIEVSKNKKKNNNVQRRN